MSAETTQVHSRLLKCALELDDARAYWRFREPDQPRADAAQVFEEGWFGARSLNRIKVLLTNFRARFDAFPAGLAVLHGWRAMDPDARRVIAHWHLQLSDPLYRDFTSVWLAERRGTLRAELTRDQVVRWVTEHAPSRWTISTRVQFASKLLSAAFAAGLVGANRDPRPVILPQVPDAALTYLLYLLRGVEFEGGLLDNPYLRSVGLQGSHLTSRLRALPDLEFGQKGDLVDFGWRHADLAAWAEARQ
jgi:hypothetical protein